MLLDPIFAAAFALTCDDYKLMAKTLPFKLHADVKSSLLINAI